MRVVRLTIIALVLAATLGACTGQQPHRSAQSADQQRFDRLAAGDVAAWPRTDLARAWSTKFVPLEFLTIPPPEMDSIPPYGRVAAVSTFMNLKALRAPDVVKYGQVDFADGGTLRVPLEPWSVASRAFNNVDDADDVPACPTGKTPFSSACALTATGVSLGTATLLTSRGPATVPAWMVTTTQLTEPIARVAIPRSEVTVESQRDYAAVRSNDWCRPILLGSITGRTVTYEVECGGTTVRPLVYETATAVVIGAVDIPPESPPSADTNTMPAYEVTTKVTLTAPLGNRPLLDIDTGLPVFMGERSIR